MTDFAALVTAPTDWSAEEKLAFDVGVEAMIDTMLTRLAAVLTGPAAGRAYRQTPRRQGR
jgi:hypothetical protein